MKSFTGRFAAIFLVAGMAACSPVMQNHGYAPDQELVAEIKAGEDTRGSVRRKIGRPGTTGVFSDTGWYYISTQVKHYMYNEPEVISRRVVAVEFDQNDVVASVNTYGIEDGRIIDLQTRTTPTHGRQLTILQQILGNIGKITGQDIVEQQ